MRRNMPANWLKHGVVTFSAVELAQTSLTPAPTSICEGESAKQSRERARRVLSHPQGVTATLAGEATIKEGPSERANQAPRSLTAGAGRGGEGTCRDPYGSVAQTIYAVVPNLAVTQRGCLGRGRHRGRGRHMGPPGDSVDEAHFKTGKLSVAIGVEMDEIASGDVDHVPWAGSTAVSDAVDRDVVPVAEVVRFEVEEVHAEVAGLLGRGGDDSKDPKNQNQKSEESNQP